MAYFDNYCVTLKKHSIDDFLVLFWCQEQDKKIGTTSSQIGPQVPSGLIFEETTKKFDVRASFVYFAFLKKILKKAGGTKLK